MRKRLKRLLTEFYETNDVRIKCTKILNFLVNDILDFAQLRSSKFRKSTKCFDIKESIDEVLNIQKYKAEQMGISMKSEFHNFQTLFAKFHSN